MTNYIATSVHEVTRVKLARRQHGDFAVYSLQVYDHNGKVLSLSLFTEDNDTELHFDSMERESAE